jgi:peroxiredoxin
MQPSEHNLILLTVVSLAMLVAAAVISRALQNRGRLFRLSLRVLTTLLSLMAFLLLTRTLWWQLSGSLAPKINWQRSPSFYITAAVFTGGVIRMWSSRPGSAQARILYLSAFLAAVTVIVGGSETILGNMHNTRSAALDSAVHAAAGKAAPVFDFVDAEGRRHTLSEYKGDVVLLNFWSASCGPCIGEMPALSAIQNRYAGRGFTLLLLSTDDAPTMSKFFASHPTDAVKGRLISPEVVPKFYNAYEAWPISYLIDRDGLVVEAWLGAATPEWIQQRIESKL